LISGGTNTSATGVGFTNNLPTGTRQSFAMQSPASGNGQCYVQLVVTGNPATLTWQGYNGNIWDLNTSANWNNGGVTNSFFNTDAVTFNDTASNGNVSVNGTVQPRSIVVSNSVTAYTITSTNGSIVGSTGLTKLGSGTLTLVGSNTFSGGITVYGGGLVVNSSTAAGTGSITLNGGALTLGASIANLLNVVGISALNPGNNTLSGAIIGNSTLNINLPGSTTFTVSGSLTGFSGTFALGASTGFFQMNPTGTVYGSSSAVFDLGTGSATLNDFNGGVTINLGELTGTSNTVLSGSSNPANFNPTTYVIGANNGSTNFDGSILDGNGPTAISKVGNGTWVLNGTNNFSGGATVNGGILLVDNTTGGGLGTGPVTVNSGATLGGTGTIEALVTVASGGILAPGATGVGTLTVGDDLFLSGSAVLQFGLGTNSDLVVVSGDLALNGVLNVTDSGGFGTGKYTLFSYAGSLITNGSASILTLGTMPNANLIYTVDISSNGYVNLIVTVPPPVAVFSGSPTIGVAPLMVNFMDASTGTITNWFWNFGDGNTTNFSASTNPSHTYNLAGSYTVALTVSGPGGNNTSTLANYIVATNPPAPVAGFSGTPTSGVAPLAVSFTDSSSGNITNRFWNFGDGTTANFTVATNPSHTYNLAGSYTVSLTVSGLGGLNTSTLANYIVAANPPAPVAGFSGTPTNGVVPLAVSFTDSSSGNITNRFWNFGDGTTANFTVATNPSHTYSTGGTYTVSLTVSGLGGLSTSTLANYITAGVPPVAGFSASPTNGVAPLAVNFTDASTGTITNWFWSFGDGGATNTTATSLSYIYTNAGLYSVSLTVSGPYGMNTTTQPNLISVSVSSATWTNANASGNWSDATSWDPVTVPDYGSGVVFGSGGATGVVDNVSRTVGTITFEQSGGFFVSAVGGAGLTVNSGISVASNFSYAISAAVALGAANTWSVSSGGVLQVSGLVSGSNALVVIGAGSVVLSGANTYGGGTTVSNGTLLVNNSGGSGTGTGAVNVVSNGTLGGAGVIAGSVAVSDGILSPGSGGVGTLTVSNDLALSGASVLDYALGSNSDLTVVSGDLALDGTLNITDAGGFAPGSYTLLTYGGTLATNGSAQILSVGAVPDTNLIYTVDISSNGYVNLIVTVPAPVAGFSANPTNGVAPLAVTFTDSSSGDITNWFWDFGDSSTTNYSVTTNPVHTYEAGTYTVMLVVNGPGGVSTNVQVNVVTVVTPFAAWQVQYFGCTDCAQAAPDADPLGKGMSNTNQFLAGLNPTNPASVFRILSVVQQTTDVVITWAAGAGRTNAVQATAGDANGGYTTNFSDISGLIILPGGGDVTNSYTDVGGATNTPSRYYRIHLVP
jgi:autotransporter-associated beta strand protein